MKLRNLIPLENARDIMQAFLDGERLVHSNYGVIDIPGGGLEDDGEMWLYLSKSGYICEEDGASVKHHRISPIALRGDYKWYKIGNK